MSNSYFQFKQFRIEQGRCAMKITTDACIQGAWTPIAAGTIRVLDIGTGTGLLALMIAQRTAAAHIDALEYDKDAALQAAENAATSPWAERLYIAERDAKGYVTQHKYDLIIANPPFFNNSLQNDAVQKSMARHTVSLSYADLIKVITDNLAEDGQVSILLPFMEYAFFQQLAGEAGLRERKRLAVKHSAGVPAKRIVGVFSTREVEQLEEEILVIKDAGGGYTPEFTRLLSPFYLAL